MLFDMNRPRPVPFPDFVANFVNNLGNTSGSIPVPVSLTHTITCPSFFSDVTVIEPSFVNLIALSRRFKTT